jgi:hypothetical protein
MPGELGVTRSLSYRIHPARNSRSNSTTRTDEIARSRVLLGDYEQLSIVKRL